MASSVGISSPGNPVSFSPNIKQSMLNSGPVSGKGGSESSIEAEVPADAADQSSQLPETLPLAELDQ